MTKLEAVNEMLSVIGEAPVTALGTNTTPDVDLAERLLDQTSYEVQARGWHWNSEDNYPISKNGDDKFPVPSNCIRIDVDPNRENAALDVTVRSGYLYDKENHTDVWDELAGPMYCEVIFLFDFDELPEAARRFITVRAARKLQDRVLGSTAIHAYTVQDEQSALTILLDHESQVGDHNILTGSWDVFRTINR
jgi:hypothetical protein